MRYTIPGTRARFARRDVKVYARTAWQTWRTSRRADLLYVKQTPVHRERVRFGAWEERPTSEPSLRAHYDLMAHRVRTYADMFSVAFERWQLNVGRMALDLPRQNSAGTMARILAAETSGAQTGTGEGPPISGPENAYKCAECAHCGRALGSFEAGVAHVGDSPVCHPNDGGLDCYRRVTVYGETLGMRGER